MSETMTATAYDHARLVELFGNNPATIAEVEREFLDTARVAEKEIVNTTDLGVIARAAHRLKGASGMIAATALHTVAAAVERAAKAGDLPGVRRLQDNFSQEVERVALQVGA
jgi:HPt (histidine-containing phosphotransfer) domain-containing protein